jgi:hypothetical protein
MATVLVTRFATDTKKVTTRIAGSDQLAAATITISENILRN